MTKKNGQSADLRKGTILILGIACFMAVLASCTTMQVSNLQVGPSISDYQILGTFEKKVWVNKFLGGAGGVTLFNLFSDASDEAIQNAIRNEVQSRGGTSAINVKIVWGASFGQLFLSGITGSLYAPATATVSGTIIKEK